MPDKDININLNINNVKKTTEEIIDLKSSIIELNNGMKMPNLNKLSNSLKQVKENAEKTEKEIKDVSKAADKLGKSAKLGKLGLEALKDNLGALPIAGQTLSRALDDVEGSFLSIAKAALPIAGIAGGLAAVGGAAVLAYKNSEKLQESIGRLGTEVVDLGTNLPIFESIGDALSVVTDNIADVIHNMNILNGTVLENTKKAYKDIMKYKDDEAKRLDQNLEYLKKIGASQEEITEAQNAYNKALVKSGIAVKDAIGDVYIKSTEAYNNAITEMQNKGFISLEALQSKIKETQSEQAEWIKKYGEGAGIDDGGYTLMLKNLTDLEKKVISTRDAVNTGIEVWRENNTIINQSAKAIEGVRSTDKNKRDELKEAREQLKALKEEQEILNDTVLDGAEAEEKKRSDLQAQLPLLEKIYILEEQRGIANSNTLKDIKSVKAFLEDEESEVEKLKAAYDDLVESQNIRDALINSSNSEEARQKEIKDTQAQLTALENLYEAQVKAGEPAEKTLETIKQLKDYLEDITKETYNWKDNLTAALSITSSIGNLFGTVMTAALDFTQIDLAPFDKAIEDAQAKLDAFNKWKEEQEEAEEEKTLEDYEKRIALLDEEIEYAKEIGDKMSEIALENKKKEIQEEMDEEQKRIDKEKAINEEEKRLQQELALAEYNKEYANWQNKVKQAEGSKHQAIANSTLAVAQSALQGAQAYATALGPPPYGLGPVLGHVAGATAMATIISSVMSGASSIKSASSSLDSIKAVPPQPPQFQFGTTSYNVAAGESILVGEAGPELLSLKSGGNIAVESNAQVKAKGLLNNGDIYIDNVVFNVNKILSEEEIFKAMNNYKQRNSFMYTR
ncbi:hypothetical protein [Brachyspira pilosicoli]|uniref:hypothetical protein n=1 Tax=Brachyspira pilosicoli TaxID=52584 RepID=UPI00255C3CAF|nr:hypothetical protein [Brachyspira pilosicoli]